MSPLPLLLENALVLTLDEERSAGWLSVAVHGDEIAAVGEPRRLRSELPGAERIDCAGAVLMPGMINAHLHPEMHVLKGVVEDVGLHAWGAAGLLNRALAYLGSEEGRSVQRAAVRAAFVDALTTGTTRVGTYGVTVGSDEVAAEEMRALGLPGHVTIRDNTFAAAAGEDGITRVPALGLTPPRMYRLHAEEALTREELEAAAAAHRRGERLVMHAAETSHRVILATHVFGATTIRLLERYGLLSDRMLLSHAVHVDEEERALLAARRVPVISSPSAEMKLSDGVAPVAEYLARGMTVALGTDSAVCNNSGDMFLECRQLGLVQKLAHGPDVLPPEQILRCATIGGATALGEAASRGAITPGHAADLIFVDTRNTRLQPLVHNRGFSNLAANLVYAATGQDVTDVMIAGRWIIRERRLLTADPLQVTAELSRAADQLHQAIA